MAFCVKEGYVENPDGPAYFHDDGESGITFQPRVYAIAGALANAAVARTVVDLGCGRAGKLGELLTPDRSLVGVDFGPNIEWCQANLPWGLWIEADLEGPLKLAQQPDLIICADVIEHLRDPRHVLRWIRDQRCVAAISTPERDLTHGAAHNGPPPNPCHVREWNRAELRDLLEGEGLEVTHLGLTASDDAGTGAKTILAVVG